MVTGGNDTSYIWGFVANMEFASVGVHPSPRPAPAWWYHRALPEGPRLQVQLREVHLPQVLRMCTMPPPLFAPASKNFDSIFFDNPRQSILSP